MTSPPADREPPPSVMVRIYLPAEVAAWVRAKARERFKSDGGWLRDHVVALWQRETGPK